MPDDVGAISHAGPDAAMVGKMERIRRLATVIAEELIAKGKEPARPTPDDESPVVVATRDELVSVIAYHFGRETD
jgi:hypothetical protein